MDIKAKVEEIVKKLKDDKTLYEKFKADPISTVESLIGIDLPNDQIQSVVTAIKAQINLNDVGSFLGGLLSKK